MALRAETIFTLIFLWFYSNFHFIKGIQLIQLKNKNSEFNQKKAKTKKQKLLGSEKSNAFEKLFERTWFAVRRVGRLEEVACYALCCKVTYFKLLFLNLHDGIKIDKIDSRSDSKFLKPLRWNFLLLAHIGEWNNYWNYTLS